MATLSPNVALLFVFSSMLLVYGATKHPSPGQSIMLIYSIIAVYVIISARVLWNCCLYPRLCSPLRDIPKLPGNTFMSGQFYKHLCEPLGQPFREWINNTLNDGILRILDVSNIETLVITKPKVLAEVLVVKSSEFIKLPRTSSRSRSWFGIRLPLAEGEEHKIQRGLLNPAFTRQRIQETYPLFWTKAKDLINALIQNDLRTPDRREKAVHICRYLSRATLNVIDVTGVDQETNAIERPGSDFHHMYQNSSAPSHTGRIFGQIGQILVRWVLRYSPTIRNSALTHISKVIERVYQSAFHPAESNLSAANSRSSLSLSIALASGIPPDDSQLNQLTASLLSGHEPTTTALTWCIAMLCQHPKAQTKLRAELRSGLPNPRTTTYPVAANEFDTLPYLNAVCNETLRLFPPIPHTLRVAAHDTTLLNHVVPAGTRVLISPWAINASRELWGADALDWKPERWIGEMRTTTCGGAVSEFALLTFLGGDRRCVGEGFARGEIKVLLAALVSTFEIGFAEGGWGGEGEVEVEGGMISKPKDLRVRLRVVDEGWR